MLFGMDKHACLTILPSFSHSSDCESLHCPWVVLISEPYSGCVMLEHILNPRNFDRPTDRRQKQTNKNVRCGFIKAARSQRPNSPGSTPISLLSNGNRKDCWQVQGENKHMISLSKYQHTHSYLKVRTTGGDTFTCSAINPCFKVGCILRF